MRAAISMSQTCHQATHALQQISGSVELTDHFPVRKALPSHKAKTISGQPPYSNQEKEGMLAGQETGRPCGRRSKK
jgi:hypothetical protein